MGDLILKESKVVTRELQTFINRCLRIIDLPEQSQANKCGTYANKGK